MDKKKVVAPLVCHGHSRPVVDLFYSPVTPDGIYLISASKDSTPMLRNGETGDWIGTFQGHKGAVWSCCLDKHALRAASASADFSAKLWDALTGDELHSFEHKHIVRACAYSEDTHLLLTGGMEKILRIFDLNLPDAAPREIEKSPGSVRTVACLHSDQTILGTCTDMGGVRLWDVRTGTIIHTLETKSSVTSAEVSQDGRYITTADGSCVKFWDANHFGLVKSYNMPCIVESASLEPMYGNKFVTGGEDMWLHIYDFHTGAEIGCNKGHHGPVHCVRFSPGGESFASGSEDGTIRIWQTGPLTTEWEPAGANGAHELFDLRKRDILDGFTALRHVRDSNANRTMINVRWSRPLIGWVKLNVDGSVRTFDEQAGMDGLIRDPSSMWVIRFTANLRYQSVSRVELWGCLHGLQLVWELRFRRVVVSVIILSLSCF